MQTRHGLDGHPRRRLPARDARRDGALRVCRAPPGAEHRRALRTLPLGSQQQLRLGQTVIALGYPANAAAQDNLTATSGVVSVVQETYDQIDVVDPPVLTNVIQTDATINPGNSGGPLVTLSGELVGMNTAVLLSAGGRPIQNQFYAIGVDRIKEVVEDLRQGISRAYPGFGFLPGMVASDVGLDDQGLSGTVALPALADTPAAASGLDAGLSLVVAVEGQQLDTSRRSYCDAVGDRRTGDTATFTILEDGARRPRDVVVEFA
ncbi:MAG: trypsin-like peptidase domain-containing protein [Thermoleophilia bacterium]